MHSEIRGLGRRNGRGQNGGVVAFLKAYCVEVCQELSRECLSLSDCVEGVGAAIHGKPHHRRLISHAIPAYQTPACPQDARTIAQKFRMGGAWLHERKMRIRIWL